MKKGAPNSPETEIQLDVSETKRLAFTTEKVTPICLFCHMTIIVVRIMNL
jgi:hypothetical protein